MKNLKLTITGLAAALCISLASTAAASPSLPGNSEMGGPPCLDPAFNAPTAGLTKEQADLQKQIFEKHRNAVKPFMQQMITKKAELEALMIEDDPDPVKIENLSRELGSLRGKMMAEHVKCNSELKKQGLPVQDYNSRGFGHKGYGHKSFGHGKAFMNREHTGPMW